MILLIQGFPIKSSPYSNKNTVQKPYSKPSPNFRQKAPLKKESIETTQKNEIKALFMNWFKASAAKAGHIMTKQDVINGVLRKMGPKQDRPFALAMEELSANGLITLQEDGVTVVLTQKGFEAL
ncbi:MAG: hypothetical protein WA080_10035 [Sulfuricurvum sp.]